MRYWWVNQNQTYKQETTGGYMWSPKRNQNGARNQFYENMREVAPGDLVFSFRGTKIVAIGVAASNCYESPKPDEFGVLGQNWDDIGWKVDVVYTEMTSPIRPKDHIDEIRPLLPDKYSPLQQTGDGLQSVYLAEISQEFASLLQSMLEIGGQRLETFPKFSLTTHAEKPCLAKWRSRSSRRSGRPPKSNRRRRSSL